MKLSLKPVLSLLLLAVFVACKKEASLSEYKYSEKKFDVNCTQINPDLLKEAVYSFEDDITKYFERNGIKNISQGYARIISYGVQGRANYNDMVSEHTKEIFKILKADQNLWIIGEKTASLNYNHGLVKCLAENIRDKDLNTTFNALLSTNSMSIKLFGAPLKRKYNFATKDKYLATYVALDLYYAKLFHVDLDAPKTQKPRVPNNTIKPRPKGKVEKKVDPHAGHSH